MKGPWPLFHACLFLLRVWLSLFTRKGPNSRIAPKPSDEHPGPACSISIRCDFYIYCFRKSFENEFLTIFTKYTVQEFATVLATTHLRWARGVASPPCRQALPQSSRRVRGRCGCRRWYTRHTSRSRRPLTAPAALGSCRPPLERGGRSWGTHLFGGYWWLWEQIRQK